MTEVNEAPDQDMHILLRRRGLAPRPRLLSYWRGDSSRQKLAARPLCTLGWCRACCCLVWPGDVGSERQPEEASVSPPRAVVRFGEQEEETALFDRVDAKDESPLGLYRGERMPERDGEATLNFLR